MKIQDALVELPPGTGIIRSEYLSHGTLEVYSLSASRRFYEEFLGLQCVRHGRRSMAIRAGMKFHIVCLQVGERLKPVSVDNHWGIDVAEREDVDHAFKAAHEFKEKYGIVHITDPVDQHGAYSFYLEDRDHNWWEIQHYDGVQHEDMFDFGDRFDDSDLPESVRE